MLFRREAYWAIGGHGQASASIVDDLLLARRVQAARMRWRVAFVADLISCRMYHSNREAVKGFTKNLFAAFDFHLLPFLFAFIWLAVMFWEPIIVLFGMLFGHALPARVLEPAICVGLAVLLWLIPYADMGLPAWLACLYPFTILANELIAFRSIWCSLGGQLSWKGRSLPRTPWKWL
jgi:chlorobactene glucosyltransferase